MNPVAPVVLAAVRRDEPHLAHGFQLAVVRDVPGEGLRRRFGSLPGRLPQVDLRFGIEAGIAQPEDLQFPDLRLQRLAADHLVRQRERGQREHQRDQQRRQVYGLAFHGLSLLEPSVFQTLLEYSPNMMIILYTRPGHWQGDN